MPADRLPVTDGLLRDWRLPDPGGSKHARGAVLVVGGSRQTPGAVLLAAAAALRAGAGKLQIATAESVATAVATAVPEALVQGLPEAPDGAIAAAGGELVGDLAAGARAVLVGPGLRDRREACGLVAAVLAAVDDAVVVVDALAMALLGEQPDALHRFDGRAVVTPNPLELALTAGVSEQEVGDDPAGQAVAAARRHRAVVALGGPESHVAAPDGRCWADSSGGSGLGVSGSGDAFAGLVTGLAARGAEPAQAAVWGAHVHGRAGDRLAARVGRLGYLAREVVDEVPRVLTELEA